MTVLVVDDEPQLRMMLTHFLGQEGFAVLTAGCGSEAISLFRSHPEIDLLITDILMPGMDGPSLAAALRSIKPDLAVLLMSGNCDCQTDRKWLHVRVETLLVHGCPLQE